MSARVFPAVAGLVGLVLASGAPLEGQIRASERGQVSQTVDGTTIKLDYSRPRARARDTLFGGEVKWGEVWTPGANYATTLELDRDVHINGHPVPKGKYSVWMTVRPDSDWTVMFDTTAKLYHTERPSEHPGQIRFPVRPETRSPKLEVLTWWFPEIRADGAIMAMQWGATYVPLNVTVEPSRPTTLARNLAEPFLGKYEIKFVEPEPDTSAAKDSLSEEVSEAHSGAPETMSFEVYYDKGSLWARWDPPPFPGMDTLLLIKMADEWFFPAMMKDGKIYDAMDDFVLEFKVERGQATGFEVRIESDELIATATRKP